LRTRNLEGNLRPFGRAAPCDPQISFRLTVNERRDTLETASRKIGTQAREIRRTISLTISNERGLLKRVCLIGASKSRDLSRGSPISLGRFNRARRKISNVKFIHEKSAIYWQNSDSLTKV